MSSKIRHERTLSRIQLLAWFLPRKKGSQRNSSDECSCRGSEPQQFWQKKLAKEKKQGV